MRFVLPHGPEGVQKCAQIASHARKIECMANKAGAAERKQNGQERDIFCAIRDAFRSFAHRSSSLLGSAWAFCGAVLVIVVWLVTGPAFSFFGHVAANHQHRHHGDHVPDGLFDSEHAEP